jgi:GTPase SAR1 family protein
MVKIALIGAPLAGKTALSLQLAEALSPRSVEVVDGYVEELQKRTDLVFGHYATYLGNLQCACARHEAEYGARQRQPDVVITCGTLVENSVYTAIHSFIQANVDGKNTPISDRRAYIVMTWLAMMAHDLWDYDVQYYLPLQVVDADSEAVDAHILESIEALGLDKRVKKLDDPEASIATVVQHVMELESELTPID